jgi:hypothetical protein
LIFAVARLFAYKKNCGMCSPLAEYYLGRVLIEIATLAMPGRLSQVGQILARRQEFQGRPGARVKEVHSSMYDAGFVTQARQGPNLVRPLVNTIFKEEVLKLVSDKF